MKKNKKENMILDINFILSLNDPDPTLRRSIGCELKFPIEYNYINKLDKHGVCCQIFSVILTANINSAVKKSIRQADKWIKENEDKENK